MWALCWCVKPGVDSHPLIVDLKIICFILQALCTRLTMKSSGSRQGLLQQKQCWNFMHPSCAFHDKFPRNCFMLQYCFLESDDLLCHGVMLFFLFEKGLDSKNIGVHFKRVFFFIRTILVFTGNTLAVQGKLGELLCEAETPQRLFVFYPIFLESFCWKSQFLFFFVPLAVHWYIMQADERPTTSLAKFLQASNLVASTHRLLQTNVKSLLPEKWVEKMWSILSTLQTCMESWSLKSSFFET